jgi:uncharacterized protein (DUF302 family)
MPVESVPSPKFDDFQRNCGEGKGSVIYQKSSKRSLQEVEQSLREAVQRHKFGILHVLDLKNTLHDKGIDLDDEVRIYDVCNPLAASQALHQNMAAATVLPCRIAVYSGADGVAVGTVRPTDLFAATAASGMRILWRKTSNENFSLSLTKRQRENLLLHGNFDCRWPCRVLHVVSTVRPRTSLLFS